MTLPLVYSSTAAVTSGSHECGSEEAEMSAMSIDTSLLVGEVTLALSLAAVAAALG